MPIGPSLPPHLAHLAGRADDSDDDEAGPSLPRSTTPPAGPPADQEGLEEDGDEDDDSFGPALPPHLLAARKAAVGPSRPPAGPSSPGPAAAGPSRPYSSPSPPRIVSRQAGPTVGPARPPTAYGDQADDDDDSDDEIGPRPDAAVLSSGAGGAEKSAVQEFLEREERWARERDEQNKPKVLQREEWMLVPPSGGILASVDPLRKRPTTFSRSQRDPSAAESQVSSVWTETPAEKAQRLADELAGVKRDKLPTKEEKKRMVEAAAAGGAGGPGEAGRKRAREEEVRREIDRHNKTLRGPSLLEKHAAGRDPSNEEPKAIWDHDRDMGITGRLLNNEERQQKIKEARNLNDRFGHGKAGAYYL